MSNPHFLLVAGEWLTTETWDSVQVKLEAAGYDSTAIPLPSVDPYSATYDMTEDVDAIRSAALELAEDGEDIILVLHSYSGQPGSDAMAGSYISKQEREAYGLPGGVVRVIFVAAYIVPEGFQLADRNDYEELPEWMEIDEENRTTTISIETAKQKLYNDLRDDEATVWASKLRPWSIGCSFSISEYACWKYIPSTYVICKKDRSILKDWAWHMVASAKECRPSMLDLVEVINTGHVPFVSRPDLIARILKRAACNLESS